MDLTGPRAGPQRSSTVLALVLGGQKEVGFAEIPCSATGGPTRTTRGPLEDRSKPLQ